MIRALYSAGSGMTAQQLNVDNIAHNLANANTVGYKARRAQFQDLLYQTLVQPGASAGQQTVVPTGLQLGLGTRAASNEILFTQGNFSATENPLDLVIQGRGFFQVRRPSGELAYTRAGTFHLDRDGNLVTLDGDARAAGYHSGRCAIHIGCRRRHCELFAAGPKRGPGRRDRFNSPTSKTPPVSTASVATCISRRTLRATLQRGCPEDRRAWARCFRAMSSNRM